MPRGHFVTGEDCVDNPEFYEFYGQFITQRPPGHECVPECDPNAED